MTSIITRALVEPDDSTSHRNIAHLLHHIYWIYNHPVNVMVVLLQYHQSVAWLTEISDSPLTRCLASAYPSGNSRHLKLLSSWAGLTTSHDWRGSPTAWDFTTLGTTYILNMHSRDLLASDSPFTVPTTSPLLRYSLRRPGTFSRARSLPQVRGEIV